MNGRVSVHCVDALIVYQAHLNIGVQVNKALKLHSLSECMNFEAKTALYL